MVAATVCNMVFEAVGRTLVVVHNKDFPTDAEWDAYLQALVAHLEHGDNRRSLVLTEGGAPSSKQRTRMSALVADHSAPTAVVSASAPVLATVRALHLSNPGIRAFDPADINGALSHLGLNADEQRRVLAVLQPLQQRVH